MSQQREPDGLFPRDDVPEEMANGKRGTFRVISLPRITKRVARRFVYVGYGVMKASGEPKVTGFDYEAVPSLAGDGYRLVESMSLPEECDQPGFGVYWLDAPYYRAPSPFESSTGLFECMEAAKRRANDETNFEGVVVTSDSFGGDSCACNTCEHLRSDKT